MFRQVAILGTGLMGGSLAAALRARLPGVRLVGFGREPDISRAMELGLFDVRADSVADALAGADLVVLAAPISVNCALVPEVAAHLPPDAVLTDLSSVKGPVVTAWRRTIAAMSDGAAGQATAGPGDFVPCHPIAGSDRGGPDAADLDLFVSREVVLSPLPGNRPDSVERLEALWQKLGAHVTRMSVADHDRVFALVSHAPHAVAFAVAGAVAADGASPGRPDAAGKEAGAGKAVRDGGDETPIRAGDHAGPGLLDLTRIAGSSPELWADILLQNQMPTLRAIDAVDARMQAIRHALLTGDRQALTRLLQEGADWRRTWQRHG